MVGVRPDILVVEWGNLPLWAKQMLQISSIPACASWMSATRAHYLLLKASTTTKCNVNVCFLRLVSLPKTVPFPSFSWIFLADLTLQPQLIGSFKASTKSALLSAVWRPKKDADGWSVKWLPSQSPINPEDIPRSSTSVAWFYGCGGNISMKSSGQAFWKVPGRWR